MHLVIQFLVCQSSSKVEAAQSLSHCKRVPLAYFLDVFLLLHLKLHYFIFSLLSCDIKAFDNINNITSANTGVVSKSLTGKLLIVLHVCTRAGLILADLLYNPGYATVSSR